MSSEEIALAAADLATVETLRARILEWEDCYDRLVGAFDLHMNILECKQALSDYAGVFYDVVIGALADERDQCRAALDVALNELEPTRQALFDAWKLIGRLDYFLETYAAQPIRAQRQLAAQLRGEIKKASEPHGA